ATAEPRRAPGPSLTWVIPRLSRRAPVRASPTVRQAPVCRIAARSAARRSSRTEPRRPTRLRGFAVRNESGVIRVPNKFQRPLTRLRLSCRSGFPAGCIERLVYHHLLNSLIEPSGVSIDFLRGPAHTRPVPAMGRTAKHDDVETRTDRLRDLMEEFRVRSE